MVAAGGEEAHASLPGRSVKLVCGRVTCWSVVLAVGPGTAAIQHSHRCIAFPSSHVATITYNVAGSSPSADPVKFHGFLVEAGLVAPDRHLTARQNNHTRKGGPW